MQHHLNVGDCCWMVSADETPENELGDTEYTSKDTSEDRSVDNALENKPGGADC